MSNNKPKIIIFVHNLKVGGIQVVVMQNVKFLSRFFDFYVVVFRRVNSNVEKEVIKHVKDLFVLNEEIFTTGENTKAMEKITSIIRKIQPNLIESHLFFIDWQVRESAKHLGFKNTCVYQHAFGNGWDESDQELEKKYIPWTRKYFCVSKWNKKKLLEYGIPESKTRVIYSGVDDKKFCPLEDNDFSSTGGIRIGFVGRLEFSKNPLLLPEIASDLINTYNTNNFIIDVFGEGSLEKNVKELAKELGVQKYIRFHPNVAYNETPRLYQDFDVLLLCSRNESLPIVLIESLMSGVPVVTSNVGGIKELVEDNVIGFLINKNNDYARVLNSLIKDHALYDKIKENVVLYRSSLVDKFSLDRYIENRKKALHELLS